MNTMKNTVIFILSVVVILQSALLLRFLRMQRSEKKTVDSSIVEVSSKTTESGDSSEPVVQPADLQKHKENSSSAPKIAIVLDDWGYNANDQDFLSENNFHITISVLPFKSYSRRLAKIAFENNKEVIVHMPMEPLNKDSYGLEENTLLVGMDKAEVGRLLSNAFDSVPYANGLSNHMGSKATQDKKLMAVIFAFLKNADKFFLDSLVTSKTVSSQTAEKYGLKLFKRDVFIDNKSDPDYIKKQIAKLANLAKKRGYAVGIGHDRPSTIEVLKEVIPQMIAEGYSFVNLSELTEN